MGMIINLTLAGLALVAVGYAVYTRLRANRFTRERYAFAFLASSGGLLLVAVTSLFAEPPWISALNLVQARLFDAPSPARAGFSDRLLGALLCFGVIWLQYRVWERWPGLRSVQQVEAERNKDLVLPPGEAVDEVKRLLRLRPPRLVYDGGSAAEIALPIESPGDTLAWREQARELIELRWPSLRFEPVDGWHEREDAWVGRNRRTGTLVAVLALRSAPTRKRLERFVRYVQSLDDYGNRTGERLVLIQGGAEEESLTIAGTRVECWGEQTVLDGLVDFSDYFREIERRVAEDRLPDSELALVDIYARSRLLDEDNRPLEQDLEAFLRDWMVEPGQRQIAVLGEYGQGKSTGSWMFAHHLIRDYDGRPPRVPLVIELRGKSPATLQPLELLGAWASPRGLDPQALLKLLIAGRLLIIFEGFDEMAEVADVEARLRHLRNLWRFCYPRAKLVFTGRPNLFLDDKERRAALGIDASCGSGPYCQAVRLAPFAAEQMRQALRWAPAKVAAEIVDLAGADASFHDIAARPSLLFLVATIWDTPELQAWRHRLNSAVVIGLFIRHTLKRQTEKSRLQDHFMTLNECERAYFMDGIAAYMAHRALPNQITLLEFDAAVARLYAEIPDQASECPDARQGASGRPLKQRLADRDDALELVKTNVRTYGMLVDDPSAPRTLRFGHKSFFERLAAGVMFDLMADAKAGRERPKGAPDVRVRAIRFATGLRIDDALRLSQVLLFLAQLLASVVDQSESTEQTGQSWKLHTASPLHFRWFWSSELAAEFFLSPLVRPGLHSVRAIFAEPLGIFRIQSLALAIAIAIVSGCTILLVYLMPSLVETIPSISASIDRYFFDGAGRYFLPEVLGYTLVILMGISLAVAIAAIGAIFERVLGPLVERKMERQTLWFCLSLLAGMKRDGFDLRFGRGALDLAFEKLRPSVAQHLLQILRQRVVSDLAGPWSEHLRCMLQGCRVDKR